MTARDPFKDSASGLPQRHIPHGPPALRYSGPSPIPRLDAGKEGDIFFLRSKPLEKVANARHVDTVMSDGRVYRFDELIDLAAKFGRE